MPHRVFAPGAADLESRIAVLGERLVDGLKPLARVAYNYRWSWARGRDRRLPRHQPASLGALGREPGPVPQRPLARDAGGGRARPRAAASGSRRSRRSSRPTSRSPPARRPGVDGPVVFMCAEFGFHASMPIYSGGLGVLAGDILKEASDQALQMIGIGLLYRRGYFRQRLDIAGRQQEYWLDYDPKNLPMARVAAADGTPLLLAVTLVRSAALVPGLAGRRRPGTAAPARHRAARERPGAALDVGAALRGQPRRPARASTACSGSAARACSTRSGSSRPSST